MKHIQKIHPYPSFTEFFQTLAKEAKKIGRFFWRKKSFWDESTTTTYFFSLFLANYSGRKKSKKVEKNILSFIIF